MTLPRAIKAGQDAMSWHTPILDQTACFDGKCSCGESFEDDAAQLDHAARIAVEAAASYIAGTALREAADAAFKDKRIQGLQRTLIGTWLRARAATIESEATNV